MIKRSYLTVLALTLIGVFLGIAFASAPAGSLQAAQFDRQVVRAYFDDPALVNQVASWKEPWEVNYDKGYLVVDATQADYDALLQLGFRLEIDPKLTAELNRPRQPLPDQGGGIPGFPCYRTVEETFATAASLASNYPTLATWTDQGDSWEKTQDVSDGFDMMVLRLTNSAIPGPKPKLFITSAIHAREYTTAELATRYAEYLVQNYGIDPDATWLLDYHEVHLMLHTNPDGRKQAETGQSWRKNTNNNYCSNSSSRGADLNRNFAFQWDCCGGSSDSQCDDTYHGASGGSEPEVQAVQNYVLNQFIDQRGPGINDPAPADATGVYIDLHSFSQLVLWPWGFTNNLAPNSTALQTLGRKFAYYNDYTPQQAIELYITDGTTDDYVYGTMGVAAYTFELGTSFFQDCGSFTNTILPDNMSALIYAAKVARTPYMTGGGPDALNLALNTAAVAPGTTVTLTASINDTRFNNSNGTEPVQNIAAAEYYIDVPPWITTTTPVPLAMVAVDGNFNSNIEAVRGVIDTTGLSNGRHILYVRGRDTANNWGAFTALFLYIIDPEVAPVVQGYVLEAGTNEPLAATVSAGDFFHTDTDPVTGFYEMQIISGTYDLTASAADHASQTVADVEIADLQTIDQDFSLPIICAAFSEDVENGINGWTSQTPWGITTESSHSPTHSWTDSPGGNYGNNRNISLTSPVIDLTDYSDTHLQFWQICDTEAGWDFCHVEVSENGGTNWSEVAVYDGENSVWEEINIAVPMLDGEPDARIRFRFTTDTNTVADGWHIDDIQLIGGGPSCGGPIAPTAAFSSSSPDALGAQTSFTNSSAGTDLDFEWDFGDSSATVTATNPVHTYAAAGTYTVTLTATNSEGSDEATGVVVIMVGPQAAFSSTSPDELGQPTTFTNTSTGDDLTFEWDFGDSSATSSDTNPVHTYTAAGTYTVTLTASNAAGDSVITGSVTITAEGVSNWLYLPAVINN